MRIINNSLLKLIVLLICTIIFSSSAKANLFLSKDTLYQEFVSCEWNETKNIPTLSRAIQLGTNFNDFNYTVKIEYVETSKANNSEIAKIQSLILPIAEQFIVKQQIGVSRKQGILEISVIPIRKNGKSYYKLNRAKLVIIQEPKSQSYLNSFQNRSPQTVESRYVSNSVLSTGKWAKIRVSQEGIYSLTPEFLSSLGFNDIKKVRVFGYGGLVQNEVVNYTSERGADYDDLQEIPLFRRKNDAIFYAEGTCRWGDFEYRATNKTYTASHQQNPYSSYSYYFITEGETPLEFPVESVKTTATKSIINTVPEHALVENEEYSWLTSGRNLYEAYNYVNGSTRNYTILAPDIDTTASSTLQVCMSASAKSRTTVNVELNNKNVGNMTLSATSQYDLATDATRQYTCRTNSEKNSVTIKVPSGIDARLDFLCLFYHRQLAMSDKYFTFTSPVDVASQFVIKQADANTQVWRIGYPGKPTALMSSILEGNQLSFIADNPQLSYVVLNTQAVFPTPEKVEIIANQNLHADSLLYSMIIIVPESGKLIKQAQRLADYHEKKHGLKSKIVKANEIYNEFSSGTPDAGAYRRYLKMLYDKAPSSNLAPRYLLLFGSCVWDNRMLTSECKYLNPKDYLLCYESENSLNEVDSYVTDDFFGFLDDGEGARLTSEKIDIGIGRIPVTTDEEAKIIVDKCINYMENGVVGAWKNDVYMISDDGDNNSHMQGAEEVALLVEKNYPNLHVKRIYLDAYPIVSTSIGITYPAVSAELQNIMKKKGALVMNYTGHGSPISIAKEKVLLLSDFINASSNAIPLWVAASCEITPFDMLSSNIGENALLNKKSGAIAFYSSARAVYSTQNTSLNKNFMYYVFAQDENGRHYTLGDANRLTKVCLVSSDVDVSHDYTENKLKYALIGDPALTIAMPTHRVVIDKINGENLNVAQLPRLKAGDVVKLSGHIETESAQSLSNFNGTVTLTLLDSKDTITCFNNDQSANNPFVYSEYSKMLYEGSDSVHSGKFETEIPIPIDIKYSDLQGRLNLYACNFDHSLEANGYFDKFIIGGSSTIVPTDSAGPTIYAYLNYPEFIDGENVNETPYFFANINDSDGINATDNGVGHDLELIIDQREELTYNLNNFYTNDFGSYTSGSVAFSIPQLSPGLHQLQFRAWDMRNNSSSTILRFNVVSGYQPQILKTYLSKNPAQTQTTFIVTYDRPESEATITIQVYDCFGTLWFTHTEETSTAQGIYSYPWNLTSNSGISLPSGLYLYKVSVSANGSKEVSKTQKLLIHKQ